MIVEKNNNVNDNINNIHINITDWGHARSGAEWIGHVVNPAFARLYYILAGDPYIVVGDRRIELKVGDCWLLPSSCSFWHRCESAMEQLYFHINLLDGAGMDLLRVCDEPLHYTPPEGMLERLMSLVTRDDPLGGLQLRQELYASLLALLEGGNVKLRSTSYSRCVRLAMEYINTHLSMRLGVAELAASSYVSVSTLSKKFRAEVGMSIGSYIDEAVMRESERLLCRSELSVLEISERFGYCDQFYFSRRFKARYGENPQNYRRNRPI